MAHTALQVPPKAAADAAAQSPEVQRLLSRLHELGINVPGSEFNFSFVGDIYLSPHLSPRSSFYLQWRQRLRHRH